MAPHTSDVPAAQVADLAPPTGVRLGYVGSPDAAQRVVAAARAAGHSGPVEESECLITEPYGRLRRGEIDVLVTRFEISEPDLHTGPPLYTEERVVAVGARHPLASRSSVTTDDLADHALFQPPGAFPEEVYDQLVPRRARGGRPLRRTCPAGSMADMFAAIADGRAVHPTIASMRARTGHPDVRYLPLTDLSPAPVCLVRPGGEAPPSVSAFCAAAHAGFARRDPAASAGTGDADAGARTA
ncbi:hypothetical protein N566_02740 [Streptomycetaceae bacterium MP113-05]|nr:hypothetical protein N566_02740 [Streptomycetaceae bacterium MP113-05]